MPDTFRWEEPSEVRIKVRETHWDIVAARLREQPKTWAVVQEGMTYPTAGNISRTRAFQPQDEWEVTSRVGEDGKHSTYVRYLG